MKKKWFKNRKFSLQNLGKIVKNDHFTNVIIQKVIKTKFVRTYVRMKNKMIKMQHNSFDLMIVYEKLSKSH